MKNLKKVLSLVLALAMALSLMTAAFAADASDYTDIGDVTYNEAVGVMTAVGVFQGNDGKFSPSATLDRASAAKLIAYLDLGAKQAEAMTATGTVFTDVPATHWAAGYIEYMAAAGYSDGVGNNKFNPSGTVSALEFGKWLLTVLGYDASVEGLTGGNWGVKTSVLGNSIELFDGVDAKLALPMTREAAAVYCLNALQATCVKYDTTGTSIIVGGTTVTTGASKAEPVTTASLINKFNAGDTLTVQLTEKLYGAKLQLTTGAVAADDFGRPAVKWEYDGKTVGKYSAATVATYENAVTNATLYGLLGKSIVDNMKHYENVTDATQYYTTVTINGVKMDANQNYYVIKNNSTTLGFTGKGSTTEVYKDTDTKHIDIVVTETFAGKVLADYNANTKKVSVDSADKNFLNQVTEDNKDDAEVFEVKDFKKGDFFLYTKAGNVKSVVKAETMSGVVSSYIKGTSVTVDGKEYKYSKNFFTANTNGIANTVEYGLGETATFVMDGMDNIIAIVETAVSNDQYVYVENIGKSGDRNTVIMGNIVNTDGTAKDDVVIKSIDKESNVGVIDGTRSYYAAGWFSYTMDGEKYKLTRDASKAYYTVATNNVELTKTGRITVGLTDNTIGYYTAKANSATLFLVKDKDDNITTYTGIANVPTITASAATKAYYLNGSDGFAKYVFIDMANTASSSAATSTSDDVFYVLKQSGLKVVAGATAGADDIKYYTLDVLKDGKVQNVDVLTDSGLQDYNGHYYLFTSAKANSANRVTEASEVTGKSVVKTFGKHDVMNDYYVSYSNNVVTMTSSDESVVYDVAVTDNAVIYVVMNKGCDLMTDSTVDYEVLTVNAEQLASMLNGYCADFVYTSFFTKEDSGVVNTMYVTLNTVTEA